MFMFALLISSFAVISSFEIRKDIKPNYPGLFWSEKKISELQSHLAKNSAPLYKLTGVRGIETLTVPCGSTGLWQESKTGSACGATQSSTCCDTTMELLQPTTVTGVDQVTYNVSTSPHGVQILHVGTCASEWSSCHLGGTCLQENRITWVLVHTGNFVPVEVPSHCVCAYI